MTANVIGGLLMAYNLFGHGHISWWLVALPWIIGFFLNLIVELAKD